MICNFGKIARIGFTDQKRASRAGLKKETDGYLGVIRVFDVRGRRKELLGRRWPPKRDAHNDTRFGASGAA